MTQTQAWASLSADHTSSTSPLLIIAILEMQRGRKGTGPATPMEERDRVNSNSELCDGSASCHQAGAQGYLLTMIRAFLTSNR